MIIKYNGDIKGAKLWRTGRMCGMITFKTMVASVLVASCATMMLGCGKQIAQDEHDEWQCIADYPCACKEAHCAIIVTNEVVATEDIGKRYVVETHHYFPTSKDSEGRESRWEVAVGYSKQYLSEGEQTDTSISNKTCFCGGPWEFTTNGYFNCKRIIRRTGMNCLECGGAKWRTNVTVYAESKEDENE